mgnify:CR=1 FL=1
MRLRLGCDRFGPPHVATLEHAVLKWFLRLALRSHQLLNSPNNHRRTLTPQLAHVLGRFALQLNYSFHHDLQAPD